MCACIYSCSLCLKSVLCAVACDAAVNKRRIRTNAYKLTTARAFTEKLWRDVYFDVKRILFLNSESAYESNLQMRNWSKQTLWCNVSSFWLVSLLRGALFCLCWFTIRCVKRGTSFNQLCRLALLWDYFRSFIALTHEKYIIALSLSREANEQIYLLQSKNQIYGVFTIYTNLKNFSSS